MLTKRLEEGTFSWPKTAVAGAVKLKLTPEALAMPKALSSPKGSPMASTCAVRNCVRGMSGVIGIGIEVSLCPPGSGSLVRLSKIVVALG